MTKMLNCPCCGERPILKNNPKRREGLQSWQDVWEEWRYSVSIYCPVCGIGLSKSSELSFKDEDSTCAYNRAKSAVLDIWNKRILSS